MCFLELRPWPWNGKCYLFSVTCTIYFKRWTCILALLGFYRNLLFVNSRESPWGFSGPLLFVVILRLSVFYCDGVREFCIGWRRARWSFTSISGVGGWCSRRKIISLLLNKQGHSCCSPCIDCLTLVLNTIFVSDLLSAVSVQSLRLCLRCLSCLCFDTRDSQLALVVRKCEQEFRRSNRMWDKTAISDLLLIGFGAIKHISRRWSCEGVEGETWIPFL